MRPVRSLIAVAAVVTLLGAAACGGDDDDPTDASPTTTTEADAGTTTEAEGGSSTTTTTGPSSSTTTSPTDEPPPPLDEADLPGEPFALFPYEGAELGVVGVAADDTLNLRRGPGTRYEVVVELDPLATGAVATGRNRTLDDGSIWAEVDAEAITGWANVAFLAHLGATTDVTSEVGGTEVTGDTMDEVARRVSVRRSPNGDEEPRPRTTVVAGPTEGDLGEVTIDLIGYQDDAQRGERLHILATPGPSGGFTLKAVEATALCTRGVSDGLCL